jgi:non-heme chloroperoxidase
MQAGAKNACDSIAALSATDFRSDLAKFDVPTLVIHGADDQIVSPSMSAELVPRHVKQASVVLYPGAPHGITDTHKHRLNQHLLDFVAD